MSTLRETLRRRKHGEVVPLRTLSRQTQAVLAAVALVDMKIGAEMDWRSRAHRRAHPVKH